MTARHRTRTQPCEARVARTRYDAAKKFLEVAQLLQDEAEPATRSVAASLAVLAGIAAVDAACCKVLGRRSRGEDHHDAESLVMEIVPGGQEAAAALRRLINLKDKAQYGITFASGADVRTATKQAERLVDFATTTLVK